MAFYLSGIRVPHRKSTKNKPAVRIDTPANVAIPTSMHIGKPANPIVKVGDTVKVGTKIAEAVGVVSVPVHSSVSGTVKAIEERLLSNGFKCPVIVIESDGEMTVDENITAPTPDTKEGFIEAVKESGIVGLGGAGFPTHIKLNMDADNIDYLIINGAECEPYVTSDTHTMLTRTADMRKGLEALVKFLGVKKAIIGIESNNKEAVESMKNFAGEAIECCDISVKVLPSVYPQGGEKVLIYHTTGRLVPEGKLPRDVGCIVLNCTTLAALGSYFETGMPLVEKVISVDGGAVAEPKLVSVPVGVSLKDVFDFCGGFKEEPTKVIYGGPMMGITVPGTDESVLKNTNAILALSEKEARLPKTTACIRCGACINTCPFKLAPAAISRAFDNKDTDMLEKLQVNLCMECGCCSFVCPANRPLVQKNKLSKALLREVKAKEETK